MPPLLVEKLSIEDVPGAAAWEAYFEYSETSEPSPALLAQAPLVAESGDTADELPF
jgi:hypothetical protein